MVAGSAYWESDRAKRKQYQGLVDEKKKKEKHEAWIRELEIREEEEVELRKVRDKLMKGGYAERQRLEEDDRRAIEAKVKQDLGQPKGGFGAVKSVMEASEERRRPISSAVRDLWQRSR